jgi:hypothetical protein
MGPLGSDTDSDNDDKGEQIQAGKTTRYAADLLTYDAAWTLKSSKKTTVNELEFLTVSPASANSVSRATGPDYGGTPDPNLPDFPDAGEYYHDTLQAMNTYLAGALTSLNTAVNHNQKTSRYADKIKVKTAGGSDKVIAFNGPVYSGSARLQDLYVTGGVITATPGAADDKIKDVYLPDLTSPEEFILVPATTLNAGNDAYHDIVKLYRQRKLVLELQKTWNYVSQFMVDDSYSTELTRRVWTVADKTLYSTFTRTNPVVSTDPLYDPSDQTTWELDTTFNNTYPGSLRESINQQNASGAFAAHFMNATGTAGLLVDLGAKFGAPITIPTTDPEWVTLNAGFTSYVQAIFVLWDGDLTGNSGLIITDWGEIG